MEARRRRAAVTLAVAAVAAGAPGTASAELTPEYDPDAVAAAIVEDPATLDPATTGWERLAVAMPEDPAETPVHFPAAVHGAALGGFPTSSATFGVLSTGDVRVVDAPNDATGTGTPLAGGDPPEGEDTPQSDNGLAFGDTDNDVTVLKVGVTVPPGANCVSLDYRFLTEEFPEFVGNEYNDGFIAEIDTLGWSTADDVISHPGDFATTPAAQPVSVDGVGGEAMTAEQAAGTTFDGATGRVSTKAQITPGPHVIYLSIFDQGDEIYDSAVFLDRLAFITEDPSTCKPIEVPAVTPPPPPPPAPPVETPLPPPPNDISVPGSSVTFTNGAATITVNVPGPGTLAATPGTGAGVSRAAHAAAKRKPLFKPARKTVAKAGKVALKLKLTKAGRKAIKQRKQLKLPVNLTFTPVGGAANTERVTITVKAKKKQRRGG